MRSWPGSTTLDDRRADRSDGVEGLSRLQDRGRPDPRQPTASAAVRRRPAAWSTPHGVRPRPSTPDRAPPTATRRRAGPAGPGPQPRARGQLIAAGRVKVAGSRRDQARHRRVAPTPPRGRRRPGPPGLRLARRPQAGRCARGRSCRSGSLVAGRRCPRRRAPRPAGSPTCCCAPAPREVVAVDVGYGQLAWALRSGPAGHRARPDQRPRPDPGAGRRPGRPGRGRPVVHLADPGARRRWSASPAPTPTWC